MVLTEGANERCGQMLANGEQPRLDAPSGLVRMRGSPNRLPLPLSLVARSTVRRNWVALPADLVARFKAAKDQAISRIFERSFQRTPRLRKARNVPICGCSPLLGPRRAAVRLALPHFQSGFHNPA